MYSEHRFFNASLLRDRMVANRGKPLELAALRIKVVSTTVRLGIGFNLWHLAYGDGVWMA
ncbi:MAG: hypothetical protein WAP12_07435 [Saccharofermentanales bacterium]|jgi:hypothetical protein